MKNYGKILVATDGSQSARKAGEHAVKLAEAFEAELHAVYVIDVTQLSTIDISGLEQQLEETGDEALRPLEAEARERGLEYCGELLKGVPSSEINRYAEENGVDLVVMGTRGNTGLKRLMLGSTAEKTLRNSDTPVLTVPEPS